VVPRAPAWKYWYSVPSKRFSPSSVFFTAWLCTRSSSTSRPRPWAASISRLSCSGVPKRDEGAKKLLTW
jgi:hypothetical protein